MNTVMKQIVYFMTAMVFAATIMPLPVYADAAPAFDPISGIFYLLPIVLGLAVVLIALILIKKFRR